GVVVGYPDEVDLLLIAAVAGGHVLLEGPPGIAKTLLASSIARVLGVGFRRVQFTPETTPDEIIGVSVSRGGESQFQQVGIFQHAKSRLHRFLFKMHLDYASAAVEHAGVRLPLR